MFLSENGFPPKTWGPHLWKVMHIVSMNYPLNPTRKQQEAYFQFFRSLCFILPCSKCREEFCKLVASKPLFLDKLIFEQNSNDPPGYARIKVIRYVILLHMAVSKRLQKKHESDPRKWMQWASNYEKLRAVRTPPKNFLGRH